MNDVAEVVETSAANLLAVVERLKGEGYSLLLDVTAFDHATARQPRFDVVYHFLRPRPRPLTRIRVKVPASEAHPVVPTLTHLYDAARFMERECHEMYGIGFEGNADLRPILLYEGFEGHPLRKDYPIEREQPAEGPVITSPLANPTDPRHMVVNIGPSHPATHGTIQIVAEIDGEEVKRADVHCGYLHRGFEKEAEHHTWHNVIPYTDRLNYCSALNNNFVFADTVERLLGVEITPRAVWIRTLLAEYSRIADHVTCVAAAVMEIGGMTAFLYLMTVRDYIYEHLNHLTGARLTHSYVRIGGLANDLPEGWLTRLEEILAFTEDYLERIHGLLDRNRIFIGRMRGVACMTPEHALDWGFTGPVLRSTGLAMDIRRDAPYLAYADLDFDVPVGLQGDNYDRYYVRMREIDESIAMVRQCAARLPAGPVCVDDPRVVLPPKPLVYKNIEALIHHFKLVSDGIQVPAGEVYVAHEAPNGELGFYVVADGSGRAAKCHVRGPSFAHMGGMHTLLEGHMVSDIVPTFGSMNMVGGECDR